jgi:hypothetical protein
MRETCLGEFPVDDLRVFVPFVCAYPHLMALLVSLFWYWVGEFDVDLPYGMC